MIVYIHVMSMALPPVYGGRLIAVKGGEADTTQIHLWIQQIMFKCRLGFYRSILNIERRNREKERECGRKIARKRKGYRERERDRTRKREEDKKNVKR